jgi:hypothetical protein
MYHLFLRDEFNAARPCLPSRPAFTRVFIFIFSAGPTHSPH